MATGIKLLALIIAAGIIIIHGFLYLIARFYERSAGERTFAGFFFVSCALLVTGNLLYAWWNPPLVGHTVADLSLIAGGCLLAGTSYYLLKTMTKGR